MLGLISVIRGFGGGIVSHALKRQESFAFRKCFVKLLKSCIIEVKCLFGAEELAMVGAHSGNENHYRQSQTKMHV